MENRTGRAESGRWERDTRNNTVKDKDKDKVSRDRKSVEVLSMLTASKTGGATSLMPWRSLSGGGDAEAPEKGGAGNRYL